MNYSPLRITRFCSSSGVFVGLNLKSRTFLRGGSRIALQMLVDKSASANSGTQITLLLGKSPAELGELLN